MSQSVNVFEAASIQQFETSRGVIGKKFYFSKDATLDQESMNFGANLMVTTISAAYSEKYPDPFVVQGPLKFRVVDKNASYSALMLPLIATDEGRQSQFVCVILISKNDKYLRKVADFIGDFFMAIKKEKKSSFFDFIKQKFDDIIISLEKSLQASNSIQKSEDIPDETFSMDYKFERLLNDVKGKFPNINSVIFDKNQLVIANSTNSFSENDLLYVGAMSGSALVQLSKVMLKYSNSHFEPNNPIPVDDDISNTKILTEQNFNGRTIRLRIVAQSNYIVVVFGTEIPLGMLALASDQILKGIENLGV